LAVRLVAKTVRVAAMIGMVGTARHRLGEAPGPAAPPKGSGKKTSTPINNNNQRATPKLSIKSSVIPNQLSVGLIKKPKNRRKGKIY
jgi:hypothetical protein